MGNETKFKQNLKLRRRENDFDSLSNDSRSSLSSASTRKKHKLVSSLISLDKGEAMNNGRVQKNVKIGLCKNRQLHFEKGKRKRIERTSKNTLPDLKKDSSREKDTETSGDEFAAVNDVKFFMRSLLEDLKVVRENLFEWMKEEMQKLVVDDADIQREKREFRHKKRSVQVEDQGNFENIGLHDQYNFKEEKNQVHRQKSVRKNNLVQHQNSFMEDVPMQHQNKLQGARVQHPKDFKEFTHVQAQNNFEEQTSSDGSSERTTESNEDSGFDNCYQTLEDLEDYAQPARGESLSWPANHSTQMHHQKNFLSGRKSEGCNGETLVNFVEGKKMPISSALEALEHRGTYDQEIESITSSLKENGDDLGVSIESNITFHPSIKADSSMRLMLPTALTGQPCLESHRLGISSDNYIQPSGNRRIINFGGADRHGYISGVQTGEPKRSFARLCFGNVGSFVQKSTPNSIIGTDFPVSLSQGIDTGFNTPRNEYIIDRERNNISSLKMDVGAMNYSGGSYDLSENHVANKVYQPFK